MRYLLPLAAAALVPAAADAATPFDYGVYASGNAAASGSTLGSVAALEFRHAGTTFSSVSLPTAALTAAALDLSRGYAALASTGTVSAPLPGLLTLTAGAGGGLQVFALSDLQFSGLRVLTLSGPASAVIVNVAGATAAASAAAFDFGALAASGVLFNFHEAGSVGLSGTVLPGSVLAPLAGASLAGTRVAGSVVSARFDAAGSTVGGGGFAVAATPEPAAWGLMLLGFGLVGAAARRRGTAGGQRAAG